MLAAILQIESLLDDISGGGQPVTNLVTGLLLQRRYDDHVANLPLVTAEQVQTIKARLDQTGVHEESFLVEMKANRIEDIRDFPRAMALLENRRVLRAWKE